MLDQRQVQGDELVAQALALGREGGVGGGELSGDLVQPSEQLPAGGALLLAGGRRDVVGQASSGVSRGSVGAVTPTRPPRRLRRRR